MSGSFYESDKWLQQYLIFHYAGAEEQFSCRSGIANGLEFPKRCVAEAVATIRLPRPARALDLGCSVGRSSFELARYCETVIGIDYSNTFIKAARRLAVDGEHPVSRPDEGFRTTRLMVQVDPAIDRKRVRFEQGDAENLRQDIGQFDLVLACNLICRLQNPMRLLRHLPELVRPGGRLFLTTPFTWSERYTPSQNWLGGESGDSFSALKEALKPEFRLDAEWDMPFLLREHARKFQYGIAQASRWHRV